MLCESVVHFKMNQRHGLLLRVRRGQSERVSTCSLRHLTSAEEYPDDEYLDMSKSSSLKENTHTHICTKLDTSKQIKGLLKIIHKPSPFITYFQFGSQLAGLKYCFPGCKMNTKCGQELNRMPLEQKSNHVCVMFKPQHLVRHFYASDILCHSQLSLRVWETDIRTPRGLRCVHTKCQSGVLCKVNVCLPGRDLPMKLTSSNGRLLERARRREEMSTGVLIRNSQETSCS